MVLKPFLPPSSVGFVDLGHMGWRMAARLSVAGYQLRVIDQDMDEAIRFAAASAALVCSSRKSLGESCGVIVLMSPDSGIVTEVVCGAEGLVEGLSAGAVLVDMGSSNPIEDGPLPSAELRAA